MMLDYLGKSRHKSGDSWGWAVNKRCLLSTWQCLIKKKKLFQHVFQREALSPPLPPALALLWQTAEGIKLIQQPAG